MTRPTRRHHHTSIEHPLSWIRAQHNWTYQDLVTVIARRVGNMAARREKAWRWEHWGVVPDRDSQLALAAELGVTTEEVRLRPWPLWLPDGDPIRTSFGWTQAGSLEALEDALEHALMDRRGFMKLVGSTLVGLAEEWVDIDPAELVAVMRGGQVTSSFVSRIEEGLPRLHLLEGTHGGSRARKLIDAELGIVVEVLSTSSYTTAIGRRLYGLAAELGGKAGWASHDAGLHAAAQRYWVAALYAAHAAGDGLLGANVLRSMSLQCLEMALPQEALALAQSAYRSTRGGSATPRTTAMLAQREARAHAVLGDRAACERLLGEAENAMSRVGTGDDDPAWMAYFDEATFYAQIGTCYLDLQQPRRADDYFARTLALLPETQMRDYATYVVRRAATQLHLGNVDQAHALLGQAVPLIQQAPSQRNVQRTFCVRERMPYQKHDPRAQELDEQLSSLVA